MKGETPEASPSTSLSPTPGDASADDSDNVTKRDFQIMNLDSEIYLCSIPILEPSPPENHTANELARAEEARELSRATESGWDLLGHLKNSCLYYGSGWWTYEFCENTKIVQYHAAGLTPAGQPPKRDRSHHEYVLGRQPALPSGSVQANGGDDDIVPATVQAKGDQRYLVQKLEQGTICDLTGRDRTIEVQYHCAPGLKESRISLIKEVTICHYLMVVNTPELCNDVAFLPPTQAKANPISCQLVLPEGAEPPAIEQGKTNAQKFAEAEAEGSWQNVFEDQLPLKAAQKPQVVGGVVVGARNVLRNGDEEGKPPIQLAPPRDPFKFVKENELVELLAQGAGKAKGGKVDALDPDMLEHLEIDQEVFNQMREEVERLAGDLGWRIEVVELPNEDREIRGYIDDEGDDEAQGSKKKKQAGKNNEDKKDQDEDGKKQQEGSEERFKDEL